MPSGVCPAFYDTTPSDVELITSADIIISLGNPTMEHWLSAPLSYNDEYQIIECKGMGEWNIPTGAKTYVECLSSKLSQILPSKKTVIEENAQNYIEQIDKKSEELLQIIQVKGYVGKKVICMAWQKDFLEWLGFNIAYSYGPPQGLSAQDEIDIIKTAEENEICVIVDNMQSGTEFGSRVASESGAIHVIFSNFPGAIPKTDTYLDMIDYNTEKLIDGIETFEFKKGEIANLEKQNEEFEFQRNVSIGVTCMLLLTSITLFIMYKKK
jgi:ABC-type Zn uptake system ZnuABC Zn-binding protein ZnuA